MLKFFFYVDSDRIAGYNMDESSCESRVQSWIDGEVRACELAKCDSRFTVGVRTATKYKEGSPFKMPRITNHSHWY